MTTPGAPHQPQARRAPDAHPCRSCKPRGQVVHGCVNPPCTRATKLISITQVLKERDGERHVAIQMTSKGVKELNQLEDTIHSPSIDREKKCQDHLSSSMLKCWQLRAQRPPDCCYDRSGSPTILFLLLSHLALFPSPLSPSVCKRETACLFLSFKRLSTVVYLPFCDYKPITYGHPFFLSNLADELQTGTCSSTVSPPLLYRLCMLLRAPDVVH